MAYGKTHKSPDDFLNKDNIQSNSIAEIGSKETAMWKEVSEGYKQQIDNLKKQLQVNSVFQEVAEKKYLELKATLKDTPKTLIGV